MTSTRPLSHFNGSPKYMYGSCALMAGRIVHHLGLEGLEQAWDSPPQSVEQTIDTTKYIQGPFDPPEYIDPPQLHLRRTGLVPMFEGDLGLIPLSWLWGFPANVALPRWQGARFVYYERSRGQPAVVVVRSAWEDDESAQIVGWGWALGHLIVGGSERALTMETLGSRRYAVQVSEGIATISRGRMVTTYRTDDGALLTELLAEELGMSVDELEARWAAL